MVRYLLGVALSECAVAVAPKVQDYDAAADIAALRGATAAVFANLIAALLNDLVYACRQLSLRAAHLRRR